MEQVNYGSGNNPDPQPGKADLLLALTRRCNLNCRYCFIDRRRKPADLPRKTLKLALKLLFSSSKKALSLQLFGGEPALAPALVFDAVAISRRMEAETGKRLEISLTTNLLGWSDAALRFLAKERVGILASLDGDEAAQTWRSGINLPKRDFIRMLAAARRLKRLGCRLRLNMVVAPEKVRRLHKNFIFLKTLGLGEIQAAYALAPGWTANRRLQFLKQLLKAKASGLRQDWEIEPVLTHPQIFCDCDGVVSVGCAAVLETSAPALAESFKMGNLGNFSSLDDLAGSRREQETKISRLAAQRALPRFIPEVIALGNAAKSVLGRGKVS
ncbi:MAG: hypothetical protein A2X28_00310 [Elusimicrobia bacterium GWA2_56_46]|jgi:sulfatase maturation enzyme AslB (radical SAM superfamily)|nr:MAG: hypothetical protein A2X28_00310 [Elusimicrobia bacterium GWA2_56_46]OGR55810.1 MAG: hypothetical protein A2X39_05685 [Elusimicrobia bacterium GWC2_56_31]HBB65845.1 hypothetical protein [Elusimicrobiota bacterium]HBW22258.1 hypothetical protein [Elusimicrobiota bacterium]